MSTTTTLTPPTQALPVDTPSPKETLRHIDVQFKRMVVPAKSSHRELELLSSSQAQVPHTATSSIRPQPSDRPSINFDGANSSMPQSIEPEDEYTLSAYGDISLGEVIVPSLPVPTRPDAGLLRSKIPQPHLRLKVRRPPMPKRRLSCTYIDPFPHGGDMESDDHWPGSPRPIINSPSWLRHQPLVSPLSADPTTQGNKPVKNGASLEKLVDELLPHSPSIRLSPPGSPASQVLGLPQESRVQESSGRRGRNLAKVDVVPAKPPQTPLVPAPQQNKPWRTRLPPRPPLPQWDI